MSKLKLFTVLTLMFKLSFSQTPITLGNTNMPGSGDTLRYSNAQLNSVGNYTQTGTNFVWNFSNLVPTTQGVRSYKSAIQTPYAFFFLGFNEYGEKIADTLGAGPITITNYYSYYKKQTTPVNAYVVDGAGMTLTNVPVPSYYSDKDELYLFPMTYPKYDSTTFKFSTPTSSLIPLKYQKSGYRVTKVDGWGTVTTPYGTANCLRLVTTQYSRDTIKISTPFPFSIGYLNYQRSYQWLTTTTKIPFLEVSGNLIGTNFTPTQVRYRDNYQIVSGINEQNENATAMQLYPNPVKDKLYFSAILKTNANIDLYSISGQLIQQQNNVEDNFIDVSKLQTGIYIIKIRQNNTDNFFKFIKE